MTAWRRVGLRRYDYLFVFASAAGPGRKKCRTSFKIGGVAVNAKTMLTCEKDLEPLDKVLPANAEERSRWTLDARFVCPYHRDTRVRT